MRPIFLYAVGLFVALGAGEAFAAADMLSRDVIEVASSQNQGSLIRDLGLLAPPANSDTACVQHSSGRFKIAELRRMDCLCRST